MEKTFKAEQKFLLMSPRKIRLVAALVKKLKPAVAVEKLPFVQKRAAAELAKVIKSAMASARNQGVSETDLVIKEIQIGEGPRLKRGIAASRGQWHPLKKRMSHIRVILATSVKAKGSEIKTAKKEEIKEVKDVAKKGAKNGTKS